MGEQQLLTLVIDQRTAGSTRGDDEESGHRVADCGSEVCYTTQRWEGGGGERMEVGVCVWVISSPGSLGVSLCSHRAGLDPL